MNKISDGPEYECTNCKIRLDPLMTKDEAQWFFDNGCTVCEENKWQIVVD